METTVGALSVLSLVRKEVNNHFHVCVYIVGVYPATIINSASYRQQDGK